MRYTPGYAAQMRGSTKAFKWKTEGSFSFFRTGILYIRVIIILDATLADPVDDFALR